MGGFQFIADLFVAYDYLCSGAAGAPGWRQQDVERLRDRDGPPAIQSQDLAQRSDAHRQSIRAALSAPAGAGGESPATARRGNARGLVDEYLVHHLSEDETAALSRIARQLSVMLNDLLVRDYFLMLAAWNKGTAEERRPIRLAVPTNLRRREDYRMPAANVFSLRS